MYLLVKGGGHRSFRNEDTNFYINYYMDTSEKYEVIALAQDIERFSKSGILIYNSEVPEMAGRKMRRVTQTIAKRYPLSVI